MNIETNKTTVAAVRLDSYSNGKADAVIAEAVDICGGLPEKLRPGANVLIKPNLLSARKPEEAATTHPAIVGALIRYLRTKNITDITMGDSPAGNHEWGNLWEKTGFRELAEKENVKLIPFENISREKLNNGRVVPVLKELRNFDAVITVPKLKTHMLTKFTGAVKNQYGLMIGTAKSNFHGDFPSPRKMSRFLAEFYSFVKPDFTLMDAVECMEGDGPSNGTPFHSGLVIAGDDAVAVDACACGIFGYAPEDIPMLKILGQKALGVIKPDEIIVKGDGVSRLEYSGATPSGSDFLYKFPEPLFKVATYFLSCRPVIDREKCGLCGLCAEACSRNAIRKSHGSYKIQKTKCILCMCCLEACPFHAVSLISRGMRIKAFYRRVKAFFRNIFH